MLDEWVRQVKRKKTVTSLAYFLKQFWNGNFTSCHPQPEEEVVKAAPEKMERKPAPYLAREVCFGLQSWGIGCLGVPE